MEEILVPFSDGVYLGFTIFFFLYENEMIVKKSHIYLLFPKVWALADSKRQGFLGFTEFITAMQVVH